VYLQRIKKHPLARVVRSDKTLVSSLEATLLSYIQNRALEEIPVWKMINATIESLRSRIENWIKQTGFGEILDGKSTVGGGSMPEEEMPTVLMTIRVEKPDQFLQILREQDTAVIARIQEGLICLDPRTVMPDQDSILVSCISRSMELYKRRLLL
jgi:L-seryl-tRNA(Ser) seleniumtransferase